MFSLQGFRRRFPREPSPSPHAHIPPDVWEEPPWEHQPGRGRGRCRPPCHWDLRRFPGPADFHGIEEDNRWARHNRSSPPPWYDGEDYLEPDGCFGEDWHQPESWDTRPFPGHADLPWNELERRWAPHDYPPPPFWDDRENNQGPDSVFRESGHRVKRELLLREPSSFACRELLDEEQHPPWQAGRGPGEQGGLQDGYPSWGYRGLARRRCQRVHRSHRELTLIPRLPCPWISTENRPSCRSSHPLPGMSQLGVKEQQNPGPPQPPNSLRDGAESKKRAQGSRVVSKKVPESTRPAVSPPTDPQAAAEATELEQAAGVTLVEPGAKQEPPDSCRQDPSALETKAAPPEESSAGVRKHFKVEPCSPSSKSGTGGESPPHAPTPPPEPAKRVGTEAGSPGEAPSLPQLLGDLQPSKNSQILPAAAMESDAEHSQASSDVSTTPVTSPGTQHPPGSSETEPAADSRCQLGSTLLTSSPASTDLRSAAVLARKEEIEMSYQQFSLTFAVVATMLLQKEPSMEAALGLALRANLRQGQSHHLRELEDFIDSYDSATLSR